MRANITFPEAEEGAAPSRHARWLTDRQPDILAIAFQVIFFLLFFWRGIFAGHLLITSDPILYSHPLRVAAWEAIRHGHLPLWTPLIFSGYPMLSMAQLGLAYPITWGYLFLPSPWAEEVYVLAPFLLGSIFTFFYLREIGRSRAASLLGGLSFAYGGMMASWLANGMMTNAVVWLPLILIAAERSRRRPFVACMPGVAAAYALSVLTGVGQGFVYVGVLALAYCCLLAVASHEAEMRGRLKPLVVVISGLSLGAAVGAFQVLESWQAVRLSIRRHLSYELYSQLSYGPKAAFQAYLVPIYHYIETTPFVLPLVTVFAVTSVVSAFRNRRRDARVIFWFLVSVVAWLLMLGPATPLHRLAFNIPVINGFRAPSRHTFELTFAASVLGAYGWDRLLAIVRDRRMLRYQRYAMPLAVGILLICVVAGWCWLKTIPRLDFNAPIDVNRLDKVYLAWKLLLLLLTLAAFWFCQRIEGLRTRRMVVLALLFVVCFAEPFVIFSRWWGRFTFTASRVTSLSEPSRFLMKASPDENRVYTRVNVFADQYSMAPVLDPPNVTALAGLNNVAGYEPLILQRYSRALGNVWLDGSTPIKGAKPNLSIFESKSHVLDLLNTSFVVTYSNFEIAPASVVKTNGIDFDVFDFAPFSFTNGDLVLGAIHAEGDTLAVVSTMANSGAVADGTPVAHLTIEGRDNARVEYDLVAGRDTAEWAFERPDVLRSVKHAAAPIFDETRDPGPPAFRALRYLARVPLGRRMTVKRVSIAALPGAPPLRLWKASIFDTSTGKTSILLEASRLPHLGDDGRWQTVYEHRGALILQNVRALPRAWLTPDAEFVDGEEALRRIEGTSAAAFDPRRTALLEGPAPALEHSADGSSFSGTAKIMKRTTSGLMVETASDRPSVLIVSEINYPDWIAWLDGRRTPIITADYLLRGVILPAGSHRIEMRYTARAARRGAWISVVATAMIMTLTLAAFRFKRHQ